MKTPDVYRRLIAHVGGMNLYGEPRFLLQWGADPIKRKGMSDVRLAPFLFNAWCLAEWRPAVEFGLPEDWPGDILGPYPDRGAYIVRQIFRYGDTPDQLDCATLNLRVVEMIIHNCLEHQDDSLVEKRLRIEAEKAKEEEREVSKIADILEDASPRFTGPVSFGGQKGCKSVVQKKEEQIEKVLKWRNAYAIQLNRGLSVG
jgi:hypothetical protein